MATGGTFKLILLLLQLNPVKNFFTGAYTECHTTCSFSATQIIAPSKARKLTLILRYNQVEYCSIQSMLYGSVIAIPQLQIVTNQTVQ